MSKRSSTNRRSGGGGANRRQAPGRNAGGGSSTREEKGGLFAQSGGKRPLPKKNNTTIYIVAGAVAAIMIALLSMVVLNRAGIVRADPGATIRHAAGIFITINPTNGQFRIDQRTFDDRKAHFYTYKSPEGKDIDFFVLRSSDGVVRAAIDACDVCADKREGYHEEDDEMVCNNCDQRFLSVKINEVKGECNPAPLTRNMDGTTVVVSVADIIKDNINRQTAQPLF